MRQRHQTITELEEGLNVTRFTVRQRKDLKRLPENLQALIVDASNSGLTEIPASIRIQNSLDLSGCVHLTHLPENLHVGTLNLSGCINLQALPENLEVDFLDISGCTLLTDWPKKARLGTGRLTAVGCTGLTTLPPYLNHIAQLDLRGCTNLTRLPDGLEVLSWLDITESGITELPRSLYKARLRHRTVLVEARIVFQPETITGQEVLATTNTEVRRVMLEQMGVDRFIADIKPEVLDRDRDAGGVRELLRVPLLNDEPLVCLSVSCPSTQRQYLLRVPPTLTNCHAAAAWIAGFDDPKYYAPLIET